jgi:hypothetical protein
VPPMETVGAIRARHVRALLGSTRWRVAIAIGAIVGVLLGAAIGHSAGARVALAIGLGVVLSAAVLVVIWIRASASAEDDFMAAWGRSHALTFVESPDIGAGTPLLREGDEQDSENGLVGQLLGRPLTLCHYTYTVITYSTDSNGVRTRNESKHPYTVARIDDVQAPVARMTLHPRSVIDRGWLDRADSALTSNRVVELESTDLHRRYKLEVRDDVSDLAVRQVFEPSFIVWCLDQRDVLFELEDGVLVVAVKSHLTEQGPLDALLDQSRAVLERIAAASAPADRSVS